MEAEPFDMRNLRESLEEYIELFVAQRERIAAAQNDFRKRPVLLDRFKLLFEKTLVLLVIKVSPEAEAAVHRTGRCREKERAPIIFLEEALSLAETKVFNGFKRKAWLF